MSSSSPDSDSDRCGAPTGKDGQGKCKNARASCWHERHIEYWEKQPIGQGKEVAGKGLCGAPTIDGTACRRSENCPIATHVAHREKQPKKKNTDEQQSSGQGATGAGGKAEAKDEATAAQPHSEEVRSTVARLYEGYLSKPYNPGLKDACDDDWRLKITPRLWVQRPNHGLVHTVRVAAVLPLVMHLLLKHAPLEVDEAPVLQRDVHTAQYMMLFAVVGRENEIGWHAAAALQKKMQKQGHQEFPHLYAQFKKTAQSVLRTYLKKHAPASLQLSGQEKKMWVEALDLGQVHVDSRLADAMRLAHDVDLMRCYSADDFSDKVDELQQRLGVAGTRMLCDYVRQLHEATGDRCWGWGPTRPYDRPLFAECSADYGRLLKAIDSIHMPVQVRFPTSVGESSVAAATASSSSADDASRVSDGMRSLIQEFHARLRVSGNRDVDVYAQLKFKHSKAITTFRKTASCVRCFHVKYDIDSDMVTYVYTQPSLYLDLNIALCQRQNVHFVRMYSLLLSKAIHELHPSSDVPSTVYRGVGFSDELLRMYAEHVDQVIYLYNFTSTSRDREQAQKFPMQLKKGQQRTLLVIRIPKEHAAYAADVCSRSRFKSEREILLACNTGLRIQSVDVKARIIELEVEDTSRCLPEELPRKLCHECKLIGPEAFNVAYVNESQWNLK